MNMNVIYIPSGDVFFRTYLAANLHAILHFCYDRALRDEGEELAFDGIR